MLDYILAMTKSTTTDKVTEYNQPSVINYLKSLFVYCRPIIRIINFSWQRSFQLIIVL